MNAPLMPSLDQLAPGTRVRILGYLESSPLRDRLQRLGLVPGTEFTVVRRAPLRDPMEIRLRGYSLALRPSEALGLQLQVMETP